MVDDEQAQAQAALDGFSGIRPAPELICAMCNRVCSADEINDFYFCGTCKANFRGNGFSGMLRPSQFQKRPAGKIYPARLYPANNPTREDLD